MMSKTSFQSPEPEAPAMGERHARWGYGYQDKVATERIFNILRTESRSGTKSFEGVRLADLDAGPVDDFVLVWKESVEGNSVKWSARATEFTWRELVGTSGLLRYLADGWNRLRSHWTGRTVTVRIHTNRPASASKHHAQIIPSFSLAEFVETHWASGPDAANTIEASEAWRKIAEHVSLSGSELSDFVAHCELAFGQAEPPSIGSDSLDSRHYRKQFDRLHKAIATWLTNNPDRHSIKRDYLLAAIGLQSSRSGLITRFPEPDIPYEKNQTTADRLKELIDATPGGYLAVVGPAGVGKSTLVQDVLTDSAYPFFVPYYAFLPSTDGNRDRAEALTFFQNVVARLDQFDSERRSLGVVDLFQGRDALRRHMSNAKQRYRNGHKTILLLDGLDHVMREVNLQQPLLNELPPPSEIPEGFLIILSGQPQAFLRDVIPPAVAAKVAQDHRRIEVSGLNRREVHSLVSRLGKETTGEERDALHNASLGNPLILKYLLSLFENKDNVSVARAIRLAGNYAGDIDEYYQERLSVPLQDGQTRRLLGLLCRATPTLPIAWLKEWPEEEAIEDVYCRILEPFVRVDDGLVTFIHDSLITFLKSETRSRLPGTDPGADERKLHSVLADRSDGRCCLDPVGRARVVHLMRAERHADVLAQLSSDWLRSAMSGFLPYAQIHPVLRVGHAAASAMGDWGHTLRLLLLNHELGQRTSRVDAAKLAVAFLNLEDPSLALSQIRSEGRLLVDNSVALRFAGTVWRYAQAQNRSDLKAAARTVYLQAKPISLIYAGDPIEASSHDEQFQDIRAWSNVAALFERPTDVIQEIQRLVFTSSHDRYQQPNPVSVTASLLFNALKVAVDADFDSRKCQHFVDAIQALGSETWRFVALFKLAESRPSDVPMDSLRAAYEVCDTNNDIDLAYAWFLYRHGEHAEATAIIRRLRHIRFDPHQERHSWGFSDLTYTIQLRWLQEFLGVPEGAVPGAADKREEAYVRVEQTARQLGYWLAQASGSQVQAERHELFRSLLLFHNRPVHFSTLGPHDDFILQRSRNAIYEQVSILAKAMGPDGLSVLRDVVMDLTTGPGETQFTPHHRRHFAKLFYEEGIMSRDQLSRLGLSSTKDAADEDPVKRQEACLEIAVFLHGIGDHAGAEEWKRRASEVSAGAGSHKDYHMAHVAEWLARSITQPESDRLPVIERFARAVEISGGRGGSDGAATVLRLLVRLEPARVWHLAVEYIDRRVLNVSEVVEALIGGGVVAGADPDLLSAVYGELHSLIAPDDTSETAAAILKAYPREQKRDAAERLMSYVRTNALPSYRAPVARALEDVIRDQGIEPITLTKGLKPGRDESSRKSSLYRLVTGQVETLGQMAEHLSDPNRPDTWNPNPDENTEFDWWAAIKKANVTDELHLDRLVARFPQPDYREIELLVKRAEVLLHSGQQVAAREMIERAIAQSKDGSWHRWLDGAQKVIVFRGLIGIDHAEGIDRARKQFSKDLSAGKLSASYLLFDIGDILELLEIDWPADAVLEAVNDYLEQVLAASPPAQPYESLTGSASSWSVDQALCRFVAELLAFPVVDVGEAARRALAQYVLKNGKGLLALLTARPGWNPVQLEHLLAAVHVGVASGSPHIADIKEFVESLNNAESLAVRSIAKRICDEQGWVWEDVTTSSAQPVILLANDPTILHPLIRAGHDEDELLSEFKSVYWALEGEYPWANYERLKRWMMGLLVGLWPSGRAIIGREAAMRVYGRRSLSDQVPHGAEVAYDRFYPIYDPQLEVHQPTERPPEFRAMEWRSTANDREPWRQGAGAGEWSHYPDSVHGRSLIGERTWFVRPEWEWPREKRYRGLIAKSLEGTDERVLKSAFDLTYELYLDGQGQDDQQIIVLNDDLQLVGPAYRWAAINSNIARALGWRPSVDVPFQWLDAAGNVMVESTYWKDGWIWIEPPQFQSLGEGWFVSASPAAIDAIRRFTPGIEIHLWVERQSHGDKPYEGKWHLSRPIV